MCLAPFLYQFRTYRSELIILIRTPGQCGSINYSTVAQSPITWLGHTRSVKIQLFLLSYSRVHNSMVWRTPRVNSSQQFITGQMLLFISIRRLETVQRNSLNMQFGMEIQGEKNSLSQTITGVFIVISVNTALTSLIIKHQQMHYYILCLV
jgi:hypothetical protein